MAYVTPSMASLATKKAPVKATYKYGTPATVSMGPQNVGLPGGITYPALQAKMNAAAPPPPNDPAKNQLPFAGLYEQDTANALKAWNDAVIGTKKGMLGLQSKYGLTGDIGDNNQVSNVRIDPNNPFGLVQQTLWNQSGNLDNLRNASFDRGLHGHGLGAQDQSDYRYQMGAENQGVQQNFLGEEDSLLGNQANAWQQYQQAMQQAKMNQIQMGIQSGQYGNDAVGTENTGQPPPAESPTITAIRKAVVKATAPKPKAITAAAKGLAAEQRAYQAAARPIIKKK